MHTADGRQWGGTHCPQTSSNTPPSGDIAVSVVQSLSRVRLFATPWTAACQASLSFTISWSLLKLMSIELVMPSNHHILCHSLLLPSIFPSIRVFSGDGWTPLGKENDEPFRHATRTLRTVRSQVICSGGQPF